MLLNFLALHISVLLNRIFCSCYFSGRSIRDDGLYNLYFYNSRQFFSSFIITIYIFRDYINFDYFKWKIQLLFFSFFQNIYYKRQDINLYTSLFVHTTMKPPTKYNGYIHVEIINSTHKINNKTGKRINFIKPHIWMGYFEAPAVSLWITKFSAQIHFTTTIFYHIWTRIKCRLFYWIKILLILIIYNNISFLISSIVSKKYVYENSKKKTNYIKKSEYFHSSLLRILVDTE